jgi:hypothetical protein
MNYRNSSRLLHHLTKDVHIYVMGVFALSCFRIIEEQKCGLCITIALET